MEFVEEDISRKETSNQFCNFKNLSLNMNSYLFFSSNLNSLATQQRLNMYKSDPFKNSLQDCSVKNLEDHFSSKKVKKEYFYDTTQANNENHYCNYIPCLGNEIRNNQNKGSLCLNSRNDIKHDTISDIFESSSSSDEQSKYRSSFETSESNELSDSLESDRDIYDHINEVERKENCTELNSQVKKRPKSTYPFGKCNVCNDKATGIHYGIATCEGCKGFFKRCTLKKEKYRCFFGNQCVITPKNRNRCKSCRFQRCLDVNMSIQGAKMGRIPKAIKEQALKNFYGRKKNVDKSDQENIPIEEAITEDNILEKEVIAYDTYKCLENVNFQKNNSIESNDSLNDDNKSEISQSSTIKSTNSFETNVPENFHGVLSMSEYTSSDYDSSDEQDFESIMLNFSTLKISHGILRKKSKEKEHFNHIFTNNSRLALKNFDYESYRNNSRNSGTFQKSSFISLESKYFTTYKLFNIKTPLKTANIIKKYFSNPSGLELDVGDGYQIILSLLGDKAYQLHIEYNEEVNLLQERALNILYTGTKLYSGHNSSFKNVCLGFYESIPYLYKNIISFAHNLPSLNELSADDFNVIVTNKALEYYILRNAPLFINNECFIMLPNQIQFTRKWMIQIIGEEITNAIFSLCQKLNTLRLNTKELALLFPYVLTKFKHDFIFDDPAAVRNINESYYNVLLYEFDLNKRSKTYEMTIKKLMIELEDLLESQIGNKNIIGGKVDVEK